MLKVATRFSNLWGLTDKYKSDVINKDNPKAEESEYTYIATFNAKSDAILGPIVVTVDKKSLRTTTSLRDWSI
jgi:hypothetical protein